MNIKTTFGLATLAMALWISNAQASTVLVNVMQPVQGNLGLSTEVDAPAAGELDVTLTDKDFPAPLASLQFAISDSLETLTPLMTGSGTLTLDLTAPAKLFVQIFADADASAGAGLYQLQADFTPGSVVPLPSSSIGLSAALLILGLWQLAGTDRRPWRVGFPAARATVIRSVA